MIRFNRRSLVALCTGLAATFWMPGALAWNLPIDGPASSAQTRYDLVAANADARFWAADTDATPAVFHYYPSVASVAPAASFTLPTRHVLAAAMTPQADLLAVLHDGTSAGRCRVVKYGNDGQLRWEKVYFDKPCGFPASGSTTALRSGADGSWWLGFGGKSVRIDIDDGRPLEVFDADYLEGTVKAIDPRNGNFYTRILTDKGEYLVAAFDRTGALRWRKPFSSFDQIVVAPDGTLRVFGATLGGWFLASLGADGGVRWSRPIDSTLGDGPFTGLDAPVVDANGDTIVYSGPADALIKVEASGRIAWRASVAALGATRKGPSPAVRFAPNGDLLVSLENRFVRLEPTGVIRYSKAVLSSKARAVAFPDDGSVLVMLGATSAPNRLARYALDGAELAPLAGVRGTERATATQATLADGSAFVWTDSSGGTRELLRINADGGVIWRQATPGTWSMPTLAQTAGGAMATNPDRVCTLDARQRLAVNDIVLACRRGIDGGLLWERVLLEGTARSDYTHAQLNVANDGTVTAWYDFVGAAGNTTGSIGHARVGADGTVAATKVVVAAGKLMPVAPADSRYALVDDTLFNPDGTARYRVPTLSGLDQKAVATGADGSLVVARRQTEEGRNNLFRYDSAGREVWSAKIFVGGGGPASPAIGDNAVYVASSGADGASVMTRFALADGAISWQRELGAPNTHDDTQPRHVALAGDLVFSVGASTVAVDIDAFDVRSGDVRARRRLACRAAECSAAAPQAGGEHINVIDDSRVASSVIGWRAPPERNGLVRIDQSGLTGGWWASYANGEGYVIDYLPATRTLFMPWFTFRQELKADASGQRWYVIQGAVPQNATRVTLPITQATGGAFDAGPPAQGEIVGEAMLSFTDCSAGTLEYVFHEGVNGAQKGVISLSRLTPATQPCTLADGTTQPAAGARPAANGFDTRMSGSWFEAATAGQGFEFVIQPDGIFFVPWFTFDPEGVSDDPERQRWFTLQGSLDNARNGVMEAPIVQGVGGAFDRVSTGNISLVGTSKLTMQGCDRARLEYRFNDDEAAGAMRGRSGSIDLVKVGGCSP